MYTSLSIGFYIEHAAVVGWPPTSSLLLIKLRRVPADVCSGVLLRAPAWACSCTRVPMGVYLRVPACTGVHLRVPVFLLLRNEQGSQGFSV